LTRDEARSLGDAALPHLVAAFEAEESDDETRAVTIVDPDTAGAIEVALVYKRKPYWEDAERPAPEREAYLLHALELEAAR
jgi:hypothetical protein